MKHKKTRVKTTAKTVRAVRGVSSGVLSNIKPQHNYTPEDEGHKLGTILEYDFSIEGISLHVTIEYKEGEYVPIYSVDIPSIGQHTRTLLQKIRKELPKNVHIDMSELINNKNSAVDQSFRQTIQMMVKKYFPSIDPQTFEFFVTFVNMYSLGLGELEILLADQQLEEIAINGSKSPAWVFHRKLGWLKTNIQLPDEDTIKHVASIIARRVGRQINVLTPLLDATLNVGDRVNATLMPISNEGNTLTIRKFASKPWTITDFLRAGTTSLSAASLIWHAVQYELSILIAGGTASGKTSMLNVLANFFPPTQRILSIEDTREIKLPHFVHWVPMLTRQPNAEGKGGVPMLQLLTNSLRQRPDRIIVGEIRRAQEAEVLFEAIHTGHSVYATIHANTAEEAVTRLTSPPINIPKNMMAALSMVVVQYRNRRNGKRRTFQVAEIMASGDANVLMQYDAKDDRIYKDQPSKSLLETLQLFTGHSIADIEAQLKFKQDILQYMLDKNINTVEGVGEIMALFYTNPRELMKTIRGTKK